MRPDVKEFREFLRTVCTVSAMMASMSFVGVSILILIYSPLGATVPGAWRDVAYFGIVAVFGFAWTSITALVGLGPKVKGLTEKEIKRRHKLLWALLAMSWSCFFVLIAGLLLTFI